MGNFHPGRSLSKKHAKKNGEQNPLILKGISWSADSRGGKSVLKKRKKSSRRGILRIPEDKKEDQAGEKDLEILYFFRSR
jgi:hypothetical protein